MCITPVQHSLNSHGGGAHGWHARVLASHTQDIDGALAAFDDDVEYDTPFMLIPGRNRVRAVAKLFSPLATESFEPHVSTLGVKPADA